MKMTYEVIHSRECQGEKPFVHSLFITFPCAVYIMIFVSITVMKQLLEDGDQCRAHKVQNKDKSIIHAHTPHKGNKYDPKMLYCS